MLSNKFCYKDSSGFIHRETMYVLSYTDVLHTDVLSIFVIWK